VPSAEYHDGSDIVRSVERVMSRVCITQRD
jgi:hypothetical protein